ncbi:MAG: hypothetical protein HZA90_06095 [Verrucomicrobia bacterium]|nr:hypothetical protein [Verrucomicrobiota bacterium]
MPLRAQTVSQTFTLQPGWNALWLQVQPGNVAVADVFSGLPIESVWTFRESASSVEFIEDPSQPVWNKSRWLVYIPTNRVESMHNTLAAIYAPRAYLVNLATNLPVVWQVSGRPPLRPLRWVPDAYSLRGLPIDASAPPTFGAFFQFSPAHYDTAGGVLRPMYRMNSSGQWTRVTAADTIRTNEACWIYTQGASDYQGPLAVRSELGDGLDYASTADTLRLVLQNNRPAAQSVQVRDLIAPSANALSTPSFDPSNGIQWNRLLTNPPAPRLLDLQAAEQFNWRLTIRREAFSSLNYSTLLEIKDGLGTRICVPVTARKLSGSGGGGGGAEAEARAHAGLWIGTATINAVSEAHSGSLMVVSNAWVPDSYSTNGGVVTTNWMAQTYIRTNVSMTPTPAAGEFPLRLLLHVDANGQARLLKEVIQMWQNGTTTNNAQGYAVQATPGRFVLVTDDTLLPRFTGATLRDGVPVGRRLSSAAFDFADNELELDGTFAFNNTVRGSLAISPHSPTNPFKHKYHPDHDNLNARYDGTADPPEVYTVTREFELQLPAPPANAPPGYGYDRIDGTYRETFAGLHRTNIVVSGSFRLRRIATTGVLNQ